MSGLEVDLEGKVVIITGASGELGRATAVEFAKNGALLALAGRNSTELNKTKSDCLATGKLKEDEILVLVSDLEKGDECKAVVFKTVEKFGKLDVVVNNAGMVKMGGIDIQSPEDFDTVMSINLRAAFLITQAAVPHLKETKGNIVNMSSVFGLRVAPGAISYCISKSAMDQMTKCTALELAPFGIRCNSVNPGVVLSNLQTQFFATKEEEYKFVEQWKANHALGRLGQSYEIAKPIVFLASNALSSFITGVNLPIDGGLGIMCTR